MSPTNTSTKLINNTNIKINGKIIAPSYDDLTNIEHVTSKADNINNNLNKSPSNINLDTTNSETVFQPIRQMMKFSNKSSNDSLDENKISSNSKQKNTQLTQTTNSNNNGFNGTSYTYGKSNVYFHKSYESGTHSAHEPANVYEVPSFYRAVDERLQCSSHHHYKLADGVALKKSSSSNFEELARI